MNSFQRNFVIAGNPLNKTGLKHGTNVSKFDLQLQYNTKRKCINITKSKNAANLRDYCLHYYGVYLQ